MVKRFARAARWLVLIGAVSVSAAFGLDAPPPGGEGTEAVVMPGGKWIKVDGRGSAEARIADEMRRVEERPLSAPRAVQQALAGGHASAGGAVDSTLSADHQKAVAFVEERRRKITEERAGAIEAFLSSRFAAKRDYAQAMAAQESHGLQALNHRERIDLLDREIESHRVRITKHREAKKTLQQRVDEVELNFHHVYTNIHFFYVAGAVAVCPDRILNRGDIASLSYSLRRVADALVNETGHGGYVKVLESVDVARTGDVIQREQRRLSMIDRSMLLLPLGEHLPRQYDITTPNRPGEPPTVARGGVVVFVHPVAAQPQLAGRSTPPPTARPADERCTLHGFLLKDGDGVVRDPCAGSAGSAGSAGLAAATGPGEPPTLPPEVCANADFRQFVARAARGEEPAASEMFERVDLRQRGTQVDAWVDGVRRYEAELVAFRRLISERDELIAALEAEIEQKLEARAGEKTRLKSSCDGREDQAQLAEQKLADITKEGTALPVIFFAEATRWHDDRQIRQRAKESLEEASRQAWAAYHMWLEKGVWGSDVEPQIEQQTGAATTPSKLRRFQVIYAARQPGPSPEYWAQFAFEFVLDVDPERFMPGADRLQSDPDEPRLVHNLSRRRAYWLPIDEPVTWPDAEKARDAANVAKAGGVDHWRLPKPDEAAAVRRLCAQSPGYEKSEACFCAWTSAVYDRAGARDRHRVWGQAHYAIGDGSRSEMVIPTADSGACGVALVSDRLPAGAQRASDPCRPLDGSTTAQEGKRL